MLEWTPLWLPEAPHLSLSLGSSPVAYFLTLTVPDTLAHRTVPCPCPHCDLLCSLPLSVGLPDSEALDKCPSF